MTPQRLLNLFCLSFFFFFLIGSGRSSFVWGETVPATQPAPETAPGAKKPGPPGEIEQALALKDRYHQRLQSLQGDLTTLQNRIDEGDKDLKIDSDRVDALLQIQDISPEEFKPTLNKWKVMRDSYADVLNELNDQIDEVNQIRIRLESKLRLLAIQEGDIRLIRDRQGKGKQDPDLTEKINQMRSLIKAYENEKDLAEEVLAQLGKIKTQLSSSLEICRRNYERLEERWDEVRFAHLKVRQQSKFSLETLSVAFHEVDYRIRDYQTYVKSVKGYFKDMGSALRQSLLKTFLTGAILVALLFISIQLRRKASLRRELPEDITLFERFGKRILCTFTRSIWVLFPLLAWGLILFNYRETREPAGLFLFTALSGAYAVWWINESLHILFVDHRTEMRLLAIPEKTGRILYRRISILTWTLYLFVVSHLTSSLLEYESEATRLLNWLLIILIFGIMLSLTFPRWLTEIFSPTRRGLVQWFRYCLRFGLLGLLLAIIILDAFGYTNLSDYLADASLKSLAIIPLLLFLKKGLIEWIDYKVFTRSFTQFQVTEELRVKWKKTLRQWTTLGLWVLFIYWVSSIWQVTPEVKKGISRFLAMGFQLGSLKITVGLLFSVLVVLYLSVLISRFIRALLERNLYPRRNWDPGIRNAVNTGLHYIIILAGFLIALRLLGFDIRNVTVLAGAFGVGLGFGLQNLANNFASGIVLLIERPVKVGDVIQVGGIMGKVKRIGARSTVIETGDYSSILVPNGELLSGQVINWTYSSATAGLALPVRVAFNSDLEKVKNILLKAAETHPDVNKNPAPLVEFKGFGESSIDFILKVWVKDVEDRGNVQTDLYFAVEKALRENEIQVPYPQREVFLHAQKREDKPEKK